MSSTDGSFAGRLPELVAVAAVVVPGLLLTAAMALVVTLLAAVVGGSGLVGPLLAVTVGLGLLGTAVVAAVAWLAVGRARRAVRTRIDDRRVAWYRRAEYLESLVPATRRIELSSRLAPDEETLLSAVRRRYVAGELTEDEFERELERALGDPGSPIGGGGTGMAAGRSIDRSAAAGGDDGHLPGSGVERESGP